jgi:hypothetical protein
LLPVDGIEDQMSIFLTLAEKDCRKRTIADDAVYQFVPITLVPGLLSLEAGLKVQMITSYKLQG